MEPKRNSYDVVVIGAGMGGLTAAALLAKNNCSVLLVEKNEKPGGYAQSMEREGFTFDLAIHLISGCNEGGPVHSVLTALDVWDDIELIKPEMFYRCIFPEFTVDVPTGLSNFIEAYAKIFPHEKQGLEPLVKTMEEIYRQITRIPSSMSYWDLLKTPFASSHLFIYRNKTFADMMNDFIKDDKLKAALSVLWIYIGLPPARLPAIIMATAIVALVGDDQYFVRGGSQKLVNAFVHGLEKNKGELLLGSRVNRILCEKGKVNSIELEGGSRVGAKAIISNVSAKQTFGNLIRSDNVDTKYLNRVQQMKPSGAVLEVFLGTDLDMHNSIVAHETFAISSYDLDNNINYSLPNALNIDSDLGGFGICVPSLTDPSVAPEKHHTICLTAFVPYDIGKSWDDVKNKAGARLINRAEALIPRLSEYIAAKEIISPLDMERTTLNDRGAVYGWEKSHNQIGMKALKASTPIDGLYLAGHWAGTEHGVVGTVASGKRASIEIIDQLS